MKPEYREQPADFAPVQKEIKRVVDRLQPMAEAKLLGSYAIGTSSTRISHSLLSVPFDVIVGLPLGVAATVYKASAPDAQYVYLQASVACTVNVWVI